MQGKGLLMKKYELIKEKGNRLKRIVALVDGPWGEKGTRGGLLEKESNLSHEYGAWVYCNAMVCGDVWVYGNALVNGGTHEKSPLCIIGTVHFVNVCKPGHIAIGCEIHTIEHWLKNYKAIGKKQNYTKEQIKEYGLHIKYIAKMEKINANNRLSKKG